MSVCVCVCVCVRGSWSAVEGESHHPEASHPPPPPPPPPSPLTSHPSPQQQYNKSVEGSGWARLLSARISILSVLQIAFESMERRRGVGTHCFVLFSMVAELACFRHPPRTHELWNLLCNCTESLGQHEYSATTTRRGPVMVNKRQLSFAGMKAGWGDIWHFCVPLFREYV